MNGLSTGTGGGTEEDKGGGRENERIGGTLTAAGGCPAWSTVFRTPERDTCGCARRCVRGDGAQGDHWS